MHSFAVALAFASGVGAARIQVDTAEAEALSLTSPQFPNPVIIRNAKMQWSESEDADVPQLLFASACGQHPANRCVTGPGALATVMENVGATHAFSPHSWVQRVSESFFWVIQPHPGTSAFTICNPSNCRCLFATDEGTVGASSLEFQEDQLWMIEPTDADSQLYTITHMISGLRLYRGGMSRNEFGIGDSAFGHRERVWPDQTWYMEDRADYCRDVDCPGSNYSPNCLLPPVPPAAAQPVSFPDPVHIASIMHSNRALYALTSTDGEHEGLGAANFRRHGGRPDIGQRFFWVIEQHQGGSAFTICNPHSSRCLFATDQGVVGAAEGSFRGDDQLWIIRATSDPFGILERPAVYTITNKASGQRLFADEYDSRNEQTHDEQGWGTASTGREDQIWLIQNWCEGREPLNCVETE